MKKASFYVGLLVVLIGCAPMFILQQNIIVQYADQLDGEVLAYMFHAKNLFCGTEVYPELMNGISKNGLFPPAPLVVVLYKFFTPIIAYITNIVGCMITGYTGMYFCIKEATKNRWISTISGLLFAFLPLFSVYGWCQYGLPLLFYAFYLLYRNQHKVMAMIIVILYGLMSSLVLVGYAIIGLGLLFMILLLIKKRFKDHVWVGAGIVILLVSYLATNMSLVLQILGVSKTYVSHKEATVRYGQPFVSGLKEAFVEGTLHTPSHHKPILLVSTVMIVISIFFLKRMRKNIKKAIYLIYFFYGINLLFGMFSALIQTQSVADFRNNVGGIIKEFQFDRVIWLTVPIWYIIFGLCMYCIWDIAYKWFTQKNYIIALLGLITCFMVFGVCAKTVIYYSDFNKNVHKLLQAENYTPITWSDFYAEDVFEQIDEFIGRDKKTYKTLSFGIFPAAALYNGFYCLDGYSNNYSLAYMNEFRKIIAGELVKDESVRRYFDEWGNRCYLISAELPITNANYIIGKNQSVSLHSVDFDFIAAREMGAEYLFSTILLPVDTEGITLLRNDPFETENSYYGIYLYQID